MAHKTKVNGTAYEIKGGRCKVGGTGYEIKKGRTKVGGTGYDVPFITGTPIGNFEVGKSVYLMENGSAVEYLVVHQGLPDSMYDSSCNGTWLLRKAVYENRAWHSSNINNYSGSTIHSYLNSTFFSLLDASVRANIKQAKIPYRAGSGYSQTVTSGSRGLSTKVFLLSAIEVDLTGAEGPPTEGACLSYFSGAANSKRIAYLSGSATEWWLRSPWCNEGGSGGYSVSVRTNGYYNNRMCSNSYGIRPALILDSATLFNADTNTLIA